MSVSELLGKRITHKTLGAGTISDVNDKNDRMIISFDKCDSPKAFRYPEDIGRFLSFADQASNETAEKLLARQKAVRSSAQISTAPSKLGQPDDLSTPHRGKEMARAAAVCKYKHESEFYQEYTTALSSEIAYLRTTGGKRQKLYDGKFIGAKGSAKMYSFETDTELNLPDGVQVTLWIGSKSFSGTTLSCEECSIAVQVADDLGHNLSGAEMSTESWRLLEALCERLRELQGRSENKIVHQLICDGWKHINYKQSMARGQEAACSMSMEQPVTFIWGPPGTGKTETLAKVSLSMLKRGMRVLMLSYSNVSVDGALLRVYTMDDSKKPGKLLRYGYPRDEFLASHEYLASYNLALSNAPQMQKRKEELIERRKHIPRDSLDYVSLSKEIKSIQDDIRFSEKQLVQNAQFLATTVTKAVVDKTIYESAFDAVIFDEASMACIPQIIFAASLASKHFICVGDFAQLPPIVQSGASSVLNTDIFQHCGICEAVNTEKNHDWLCMLDTQYRMHPDIAGFSSIAMYHSLLNSDKTLKKSRAGIVASAPMKNMAIGVVDLSGMMSVCTLSSGSSHVNVLSAFVSICLALQGADSHDVGIITPYYAQARLLHAMARDISEAKSDLHPISCATVHQFQGSERDMIVYDAVDCYRQKYPGMLLTSTKNNNADRLFNVAMTRARGKFVVVANTAYMFNKSLPNSLFFSKVLRRYMRTQNSIDGTGIQAELHHKYNEQDVYWWGVDVFGNNLSLNDMASAKKEIRIDIPGTIRSSPQDIEKFTAALRSAKERGVKVIVRAEEKLKLPEALQNLAIQSSWAINPIMVIDKRITWFGKPNSAADFISEGSRLPTNFRPVIRFKGAHTANALYNYLEMDKTIEEPVVAQPGQTKASTSFSQYVTEKFTCEKCGKPLRLKRGKSYFLGCTGYPDCSYTQKVGVDLVEKYFAKKGLRGRRCPQCGLSLEAKQGAHGVYVQCCGSGRHRYGLDQI